MKTRIHTLPFLLLLLLATACREVPTIDPTTPKGDTLKENMISANRIIAQTEEQQIVSYAQRRGWKMQRLSNGAYVQVLHRGTGSEIDYEDTVTLRYSIENLAGQVLYEQRHDTVMAGHLKPVRGLDAAILTMRRGTQARVILPSEQAYGVIGDTDRIGSRMVLIYKLEVN